MNGILDSEGAQSVLRGRDELLAVRAADDLRAVMALAEGRRFIWDLIERAGVFGPSYASDAGATAYNEGRRAVGIALLTRVQQDAPDAYALALNEALAEAKADAHARHAAELAASQETE